MAEHSFGLFFDIAECFQYDLCVKELPMARITVEDCQERVDNRFLLVQMAIKRVRQYREGYDALIESRNKEVVTALREIAAGKVMPDDPAHFRPLPEGAVLDED